jgi:hypothetical protein
MHLTLQTFLRLLLANCQSEFESRAKKCAGISCMLIVCNPVELLERGGGVMDEELLVARKKMLGNIKFIGFV